MNPSRRKWITTGLGAAAAASGLAAAARIADRYGLLPPDCRGLYGPGATLTYASHRVFGRNAMAREFPPSLISKPSFVNGPPPKEEAFTRHQANGFVDWRLTVDGMVQRPATYSLSDLRSQPTRSQITHLACEEGWSFIAEWTGVPLAHILQLAGVLPQARYLSYFSIQKDWSDNIDIDEAMHPQTLIAHTMNGAPLPIGHGGPLRLRVPRQLGYKSVKYITRLTLTDKIRAEGSYSWYAGI